MLFVLDSTHQRHLENPCAYSSLTEQAEESTSAPSHSWETPEWSEQRWVYVFCGTRGGSNWLDDAKHRKMLKRVPAQALEKSHYESNVCTELLYRVWLTIFGVWPNAYIKNKFSWLS